MHKCVSLVGDGSTRSSTASNRAMRRACSRIRFHVPYFDSKTSSQSPSPSALFPGGIKYGLAEFANGELLIAENFPLLGSYHRAVTGPLSWDKSTLSGRREGIYAMASRRSGVSPAVT